MTKVLFIVPPNITYHIFMNPPYNKRAERKKYRYYSAVSADMPLGVISMSAYIKRHASVETRAVDMNVALNALEDYTEDSFFGVYESELKQFIEFNPDVVCISALFTTAYRNMIDLSICCRGLFPSAYIFGGGGVPTVMYREILGERNGFDALCYGEGEKPLLGFINAVDKPSYLDGTPSWITKDNILRGEQFRRDLIEDLDDIPFGDYGIVDPKNYGVNGAMVVYASVSDERFDSYHYMTSRGCVFRCVFCAGHNVNGRGMRYYSTERIREDLERLKEQFGAKTIVILDDHFMCGKERVIEIVRIKKELGLRFVFQNGIAINALDRDILERFKDAGIDQVILPVESGSERVLREVMHKPLSLSIIKRVCKDCRELGIYMNANLVVGMPGETKQDMEDSAEFLRTIGVNWFHVNCAMPLAGSDMHKLCEEKGYLASDWIGKDYKATAISTEDFTAEYLQERLDRLNLELNFVYNSDFIRGEYETALKGLEMSILAKHDHAIAYYYASKCYEHLGQKDKAKDYMDKAIYHLGGDPFWKKYSEMYSIPIGATDER